MANPEHLDILKQGVEVWNRWREENRAVRPYLNEADLRGVKLSGANLSGTNLSGAYLTRTFLSNTIFADTKLAGTQELDRCLHQGPSTLDHRTLAQNPHLPKEFLRGCGLSDLDIEAYRLKDPGLSTDQVDAILYRMHDLRVGQAVSYHSCFISYSSKDNAFAHKLHDSLQDAGVRCWFAPEKMKIGSKLRYAIDQAIHLQDQLLLILSESSVQSPWVEQEVETALEKEDQEDRTVLLPIRIDQAVMNERAGWAALLRRTRHIGDFSGWTDRDKYSTSFERLLRDLRATG